MCEVDTDGCKAMFKLIFYFLWTLNVALSSLVGPV